MRFPYTAPDPTDGILDWRDARIDATGLANDGPLSGAWNGGQHKVGAPDRITVIDLAMHALGRTGKGVRFEVQRGDRPLTSGDRAEVQAPMLPFEQEGRLGYYTGSVYIPTPTAELLASGVIPWAVLAQWHNMGPGSPPVGLYVEQGQLRLRINRYPAGAGTPLGGWPQLTPWQAPVLRWSGKWLDYALLIRWSADDNQGTVKLWVDGDQQTMTYPLGIRSTMVDPSGRLWGKGTFAYQGRTLVPGASGVYRKTGAYFEKDSIPAGRAAVIYNANIRSHDGALITPVQPQPNPDPPVGDIVWLRDQLDRMTASRNAIARERDDLALKLDEMDAQMHEVIADRDKLLADRGNLAARIAAAMDALDG